MLNNQAIIANDTIVYSTYKAQDLFYYFMDAMTDNNAEINEKKDNKMKFKFKIFKEQTEEDKAIELPQEGLYVKFKINKVDENTAAMEFTKLAGDSLFFREKLTWMKSILGDFTDATAATDNQ